MAPNLDRELVDVSAKQLIYAHNHGMTRWVGSRLVRVWNGHAWVSPDVEFGEVRKRKSEKADTENFDAETPDAQIELARAMDLERLRGRLGRKACVVLDMAAADSTLAEIGEYLGFSGQYAQRSAGKVIRAAVAALNAALGEEERRRHRGGCQLRRPYPHLEIYGCPINIWQGFVNREKWKSGLVEPISFRNY